MSQKSFYNNIYLVTERNEVSYFFRKTIGFSKSLKEINNIIPFINNEDMAFFDSIIILDAVILRKCTKNECFELKSKCHKLICLIPMFFDLQSKEKLERFFSNTISFPVEEKIIIDFFNCLINKWDEECQAFTLGCYSPDEKYFKSLQNNSKIPVSVKSPIEKSLDNDSLMGFFIGESPQVKKLRFQIADVAVKNAAVLLLGETGTGKTTGAGIIHSLSSRSNFKMKSLNVSTIVDSLAESTFFGTDSGAYTDAVPKKGILKIADKSTLFLDEIGVATKALQAMLLTVIETGMYNKVGGDSPEKIDIRLICATNENLGQLMKEGTFREDFFYRISECVIKFPALRERKCDIPYISTVFMEKNCKVMSEGALCKLQEYSWPGNIRELNNCLKRAVSMSKGEIIYPDDIDFSLL